MSDLMQPFGDSTPRNLGPKFRTGASRFNRQQVQTPSPVKQINGAMVTVVENVYFQGNGIEPQTFITRFQIPSTSGEQIYVRQEKIGTVWKEVTFGWVKNPVQVILTNQASRITKVISQEELTAASSRFLIATLHSPQEITSAPPGGDMLSPPRKGIEIKGPTFYLPAGQSLRFVPTPELRMWVMIETGNERTLTITAIPG